MTVQPGHRMAKQAPDGARPRPLENSHPRRPGSHIGGDPAAAEFVGREDSLGMVRDALERMPALVLIEGEAGIGKTRLLHEALCTRNDTVALLAQCPPLEEPFPLGSVVAALRTFGEHIGRLELSPLVGALRPLFPEWADDLPPALESLDDPKETRHRIFRAFTELVERLEVGLVVLEDAHWADNATLEWLLTLTTLADPVPSIVLTYRPTDVPEGSVLRRLTSRRPAGWTRARVALQLLDVDHTRRLVGSMLRTDEVSERFAEFLHAHTDGLPMAVEETVLLMRERHDIIRQHGSWVRKVLDELDVPPTVRDSVLERLERLEPEARAILWAAVVLGEPASEVVLTRVADLKEEAGRQGIARGLTAGLLREVGGGHVAVRHALDAKAVEEVIPTPDLRALHSRAARVLRRQTPEPVARLARHYRAANDTEQWCNYAAASAELAWDSGDARTATATLLEVLTTIEHPLGRRVRLTLGLGRAAFFGGAISRDVAEQVVSLLRSTLAVAEAGRVETGRADNGELRLLLGRMLWRLGEVPAGVEEMEAAIPDLRPELAIRAMTNLALPVHPDWPASRHLQWLKRAAELGAEEALSPTDRLRLKLSRATTLLLFGQEAGWEVMSELPRSVSSAAEESSMACSLLNVCRAVCIWGRYEHAREQLGVAKEFISATGNQRLIGDASVTAMYLDWYTGAWERLSDAATVLSEASEADRLLGQKILASLDLIKGSRASGERHLREVVADATVEPADPGSGLTSSMLARLCLYDGAPDEALAWTGPVVELIARKGMWLWATDVAAVHLDALVATDQPDKAAEFVSAFSAGLESCSAPAPRAALMTIRGVLAGAAGDEDRAVRLLRPAARAWAALPRPYDELLTFERLGRCRLAMGDTDEGLAVLSDVEQRLQRLGAKWDADRVAHELRRYDVEVTRTWRRGRRGYGDELSPREIEVVELVAEGMTNREVAERLFISPKTVHRHVATAMRKVSVSSRTALAVAASRAGLLSTDDK